MSLERGRLVGILLVAIAAVLWSSAGLFVRAIDLDVWQTLGWRAVFGSLSLLVVTLVQNGRNTGAAVGGLGVWGLIAVPISALSMYGYVAALTITSVANVMAMYATIPFVAAGIAYVWLGERPTRRVIVASFACLFGILVMASFAARPDDVHGIALAFMMTAGFSFLLVLARREQNLQMAPINGLGAALCVVACLPAMMTALPDARQLVLLAAFGITTNALAYLLFLTGGRRIPPAEAGLIGLLDVVLGPLWVWLAFSERPSDAALVGGAIVLAATAWYLAGGLGRRAPAPS